MKIEELRTAINYWKNHRRAVAAHLDALLHVARQDQNPSIQINQDVNVAMTRASLIVLDNYIELYGNRATAATEAAYAAATIACVHGYPVTDAHEASTNKTNETKVVDSIAYKPYLH